MARRRFAVGCSCDECRPDGAVDTRGIRLVRIEVQLEPKILRDPHDDVGEREIANFAVDSQLHDLAVANTEPRASAGLA